MYVDFIRTWSAHIKFQQVMMVIEIMCWVYQDLQQVMVSGPNLNETSIVSGGYGGPAGGIIPTSSIKGTRLSPNLLRTSSLSPPNWRVSEVHILVFVHLYFKCKRTIQMCVLFRCMDRIILFFTNLYSVICKQSKVYYFQICKSGLPSYCLMYVQGHC